MRQDKANILLNDISITIKIIPTVVHRECHEIAINNKVNLHIEGEFEFGVSVRVVDFEEAVDELPQVDVVTCVEIENGEEAFANDTGEGSVL